MTDFLYIHIPFCVRKCVYCDFLSFAYDELTARAYVDALCKELLLKKDAAGELRTVYIGGGTPSLLPEGLFKQLFSTLTDNFRFSSSAEITVEANPGTLDRSTLDALVSLGINRISLGVQSFCDDELRTLGRIHNAVDAIKAAELIKKTGLNNFSLDLMYGIPGQTMDTWHETLSRAAGLSPCHISAYELTPEEHTPFFGLMESGKIRMPEEDTVIGMYEAAIEYLSSAGFEHYEISNYAQPGCRCIHNMNYWERGEYIGAGAGAHSFINGVRSRNTADLSEYIRKSGASLLPEVEVSPVSREEAIREFLFLGLRKTEGIRTDAASVSGIDIPGKCRDLIEDGFMELSGNSLRLTRKGLPVSNTIIVNIFEKLGL